MGLRPVHNTLSLLLCCELSAPAPCGVPPMQSCLSCTDPVWASHRLHLFRHCSSTAPQADTPPTLLPHCQLLPTGCSSNLRLLLQRLSWTSYRHILCCSVGSFMAALGDLLLVVPAPPWALGNFCTAPGAAPTLFLHWPWYLQGCSQLFNPLSSFFVQQFFPLLNLHS